MLLVLCLAFSVVIGEDWTLNDKTYTADEAVCDPVKQHVGYFSLTTGDKHYFYWFFESRGSPSTDPVVLWMTGGPGCSSEVALFGENGPCQVNKEGNDTISNPYSWNNHANLLYIDQPTGTGFSYGTGLDHNEVGVANDMYDFLQQFFKTYSEYQSHEFFAFGESYGGHYVPAVTHKIWQNNNNLPTGAVKINLIGTAVGNGLTDPLIQYKYYPEMGISTNGHSPAFGKAEYDAMSAAVPPCLALIDACQALPVPSCLAAIEACNLGLLIPYTLTGLNPYDMRIKCAKEPLCYDFSNVGRYLKMPAIVEYLGVKGHTWEDCNRAVAIGFELGGDWMKDYQQMIPDQLAAGIRVLIYAGDQDYICNWLGNQAWTLALDWPGKDAFNKVTVANWTVADQPAGTLRQAEGFNFLRVFAAGHMVPRDQPKNALAMVNAFITNKL